MLKRKWIHFPSFSLEPSCAGCLLWWVGGHTASCCLLAVIISPGSLTFLFFFQKCFHLWVGSTGTGDVPETTGPGHGMLYMRGKEGMYSSLQPNFRGLKELPSKCEELSCGKVVNALWSFRGQSRTNGQKLLRGRLWFNMGTW